MPQGLPRKIKNAFIIQALAASLVMAFGVACAALGVRHLLLRDRLADEAAAVWTHMVERPAFELPRNSRMDAYFVAPRDDAASLPPELRPLSPGHHLPFWGGSAVFVERRRAGTLYIRFDPGIIDDAVFWTGSLSLLLALCVTYLSAWLTYRTSRRMVAPVSWLAEEVEHWDPLSAESGSLAPQNLPVEAGLEVQGLANALRGMASRVAGFVDRERQFTRDASHELRTPLTVIRVASDIMAGDPGIPARSLRAVGRIQRAGHEMQAVIDAFFILARDAEIDSESERFDLREVIDAEVARARGLLVDKPVELTVHDAGEVVIDAPRRVLSLIIGNLLSNAVRFTERGRIDVVVGPERLEVRDTGVGMAQETLAKAFDAFYRHDRDREDGMGIGLSIVRRLGERFGWPVELESTLGEGTVARIRLRD